MTPFNSVGPGFRPKIGGADNSNSQTNPNEYYPSVEPPFGSNDDAGGDWSHGGGGDNGDGNVNTPGLGTTTGGGGYTPAPNDDSFSLANISKWFDNLGNGTGALSRSAMLIPALATAYNSYRNSQRIQDTAKHAAEIANPFGGERQYYIDKLHGLYEDPSKIADTPGYKFALQQGIGATERANASQGYMGSGKMSTDLMDYSQGLASQTWDKERNALMQLSGSQFNPANAADMLMRGEEGGIKERGNALAALGQLLKPGNSTNITNNTTQNGGPPGGGGKPTGNPDGIKLPNGTTIPTNQILTRLQNSGMDPRTAAMLMRQIIGSPDGLSPSTIAILNDAGINTGVDQGGMDHAGFGQNGFGGPNDISTSGQNILDDQNTNTTGGSIFSPGSDTIHSGGFQANNPFGPDSNIPTPESPVSAGDINFDDPPFTWTSGYDLGD